MSQNVNTRDLDLGEIRRRAYRAVTQDGLLELLMGIGFAAAATFVALDVFLDVPLFFLIGVPASLLPLMIAPLRRRFTHPRIGYVEMVSEENKRLMRGMAAAVFLLGVLVLIIILLALALQEPFLPVVAIYENFAAVLGLLLGIAFLYMAVSYAIIRFYAFGLLSIVGGLVAQTMDMNLLTPTDDPVAKWMLYFAVMAVVLLPSGAMIFERFLRNNPILEENGG
ncbi:MAG: hypothetical protein K8L99_08730 [Anaerolineae bacterium]|nr:hypothetical protein [Anaerolineae bacterium]